jgi:hypothetical protein
VNTDKFTVHFNADTHSVFYFTFANLSLFLKWKDCKGEILFTALRQVGRPWVWKHNHPSREVGQSATWLKVFWLEKPKRSEALISTSLVNRCNCGLVHTVTNLSLQRSVFDPRTVHAGFVVDQLTVGHVFLQVPCFPMSTLFYQCSTPYNLGNSQSSNKKTNSCKTEYLTSLAQYDKTQTACQNSWH